MSAVDLNMVLEGTSTAWYICTRKFFVVYLETSEPICLVTAYFTFQVSTLRIIVVDMILKKAPQKINNGLCQESRVAIAILRQINWGSSSKLLNHGKCAEQH
jgi:hypothetical protein